MVFKSDVCTEKVALVLLDLFIKKYKIDVDAASVCMI